MEFLPEPWRSWRLGGSFVTVGSASQFHQKFTTRSRNSFLTSLWSPTMQRGFVIQLYSEADLDAGKFVGRVEHVDTGRADGFRSAEELVRFIEQTVKEIEEAAPGETQESSAESSPSDL